LAYLAVVIDLYSRKVVGWESDDNMRTSLPSKALKRAIALRTPSPGLTHHTDRGVQYTSDAYVSILRDIGAIRSMSRKGNCWDNAVAESFFGTLKQELVNDTSWKNMRQAQDAINDYIGRYYNQTRLHSTIGYLHNPVVFETNHAVAMR